MNRTSDTVRVLHVDDEPELSALAAEFLERQDDRFVVETASDAAAGRERLDDDVDCVVSDYEMPGMDGIEFLTAVREEYPDLPFILFTGKGSEEVASDAISADVTDYLRKGSGTDQYELLANRITNAVSQVRAERQLQAERRRFEALFENLPQAVVEVEWDDAVPIVKQINPRFTEVFGYDAEGIVGQSLDEYVVPEDGTGDLQRLNRRIRSEEGFYSEEVTRVTADGPRRFLLQTATYGDGAGAFAVYVDITDRRRRERELERQNDLFRKAQAMADVGAWEYDIADDGLLWSERMYEIHGYPTDAAVTLEEAIGTYHPEDRPTVREALTDAIERGEPFDVEARLRTPAGECRWVRTRGDPQTEDGSRVRVRGTVRNVTDHRNREAELQRERDRYQSLFENNPLIIWEEDFSEAVAYLEEITAEVDDVEAYLLEHPEEITELRERVEIIDVNQNAVEYYDAPSKAALIDNVEELFGEEAIEAMAAEWAGIADGRTRFRNEAVSHTLSGEEHRELVDMFVPEQSADDYSRVYVIGTDITEQKQRERELKRQNERLDAFASVVSHDLRSPLSVAAGRLELAAAECDSEHLDAVSEAHDRMAELIDDLLELARQGHPVGETEAVALGAVLERCWETVATGDASLHVETDRSIRADPNRLRQLFENLYRNSVEHGSTSSRTESDDAVEHAGADVTVTAGALDDGFYVEDDGPGIPEGNREDVFDAGYSTAGDGTGFGLSIVKEVVEAHGWTITVTEGTDGGARFEVTGVSFADE